ncbi:MAG: methionyl-tRNA formyltransferase [Atopobiaceae bacterium]|jgi:methionyl-tRNA formyltransferase|nr:methionyl-tRNA formyltransferase [Atopobiaceae bacterium]
MRVVFMGTPSFAVCVLEQLVEAFDVPLVVTRPDAVRGRGKTPEPSPVKERARAMGIEVVEASRMTPEVKDRIRAARPDIVAVAAFGCILPDDVLEIAPRGCVNVHASLLPRWRGAAPVQRAILAGDERAGVSIMRVVHDLDAGAYSRQGSIDVGRLDATTLMRHLGVLGGRELVATLWDIEDGADVWTEQDPALVTYANKVTKAEMRLDPAGTALENARRVQASTDAAPARCAVAGKGLRVLAARVSPDGAPAPRPGTASVGRAGVVLGCADGGLELLRVRPDGKRAMDAAAWAAGIRDQGPAWSAS